MTCTVYFVTCTIVWGYMYGSLITCTMYLVTSTVVFIYMCGSLNNMYGVFGDMYASCWSHGR